MIESVQHLIDIVVAAIVAGLGWLYRSLVIDIKALEKDLTLVKVTYVSKEDLKDLKEVIERGFEKLETKLDRKQDK